MNTINYIMGQEARIDICKHINASKITDQIVDISRFKIPHLLFKYAKIDRYIIENLKKNELTATSPIEFNDLYDSKMHFNYQAISEIEINKINEGSNNLGLDVVINDEIKGILMNVSKELDECNMNYKTEDFRIACLSEIQNDVKMWAHYANCNKGICLAYDFYKSKTALNNFIYPVIYVDRPMDVTELCEEKNQVMLSALISTISKFKDWGHENEWRILLYNICDREILRFQIPDVPNPEYILLGNRFISYFADSKNTNCVEYRLIKEFLEYIDSSNIELRIAKPQIRSFQLDFENISVEDIYSEM